MAMHTVAFSESQDAGGVAVNMAAVPDPSIRVSGDDLTVPNEVNKVIGALACVGASATRAALYAPSLRRTNPYEIQPLTLALFPTTPQPIYFHQESPCPLDTNESLNAQLISNPAAAEQASIAVFLADGVPAPVNGKVYHVRFTTTSTLVAGQWVNSPIDFVDDLPTGVYSVVGAMLVAASAVVARFYPVGQKWRPGFPVLQTIAGAQDPLFRNGALGKWFDFDQIQPPTIDILSSAAVGSTTYTGVLDVIPV